MSNDNRDLSEVFKELQQARTNAAIERVNKKNNRKSKYNKIVTLIHNIHFDFSKLKLVTKQIKLSHIVIIAFLVIICVSLSLTKNVWAKEDETIDYEVNEKELDIKSIISQNANVSKYKEQVLREHDVKFKTEFKKNANLPKDEEVVKQKGVKGKDKVTAVKTYDNGKLVEEVLVSSERVLEPIPEIVEIGTSKFLKKQKVHIDDTLYLLDDVTLKTEAKDDASNVTDVKKYMNVKLLEMVNEKWCKVSFGTTEGFVRTSNLTSESTTPSIVDKNRLQKILLAIDIEMPLNRTSGLTLDDYEKIFTGLENDTNKIFEDNYKAFYDMEEKYNINGIFLASIAIHESGWGGSQIAGDKKNLFGYGAYDRDPYEYAYNFDDYSDGIETVAESLAKYYLNPVGTILPNGDKAVATYYNGSTVKDVNVKYASDQEWYSKVFNYIEMLYNRLGDDL